MAEYTPTTKELRDEYVYDQLDRATSPRIAELSLEGEFDRWLAQHDAEVAAKALEDAADEFEAAEQRYAIVHAPSRGCVSPPVPARSRRLPRVGDLPQQHRRAAPRPGRLRWGATSSRPHTRSA